MERFSKKTLAVILEKRIEYITRQHGLEQVHANGTAQLRGKSDEVDRAVAYGERKAMARIMEDFDLWDAPDS